MSKGVKVDDQVYEDLDELRGKGETFSQVIESMIATRANICRFLDAVEGSVKYREWQIDQLRKKTRLEEG